MQEPKRNADINSLVGYVRDRVELVLERMKKRGYDPMIFEAKRSKPRQSWLYGIGRTHDLGRRPVTWTMLSNHLDGKAVDIISKSRGWNWPQFYTALREEARRVGMHTLDVEQCHVEWRG